MRGRRVAVILSLCIVNWTGFAGFLVTREPYIHHEKELDSGEVMASFYSGEPLTHIAGRPLYSWNSWHGGESLFVKVLEVFNSPALAAAHVATPLLKGFFVMSSGSYRSESWVRAWLFIVFATLQWILIGTWIVRDKKGTRTASKGQSL